MRGMLVRRSLVLLLAVLLPGALLWPVWRNAGLGAGEDDILYYFPSRYLLHQMIVDREYPWLNPWTGLGRPLLADPQTAAFYPSTWLFAFDPLVAYPASLWIHYALALLGMYRLLRAHRLDACAAVFGAIAFAFCGFMLAHRAHFSMQHAAAWTPWLFWRLERYVAEGGNGRLAGCAVLIALQCYAGHVQAAALCALGSLAYLIAQRGEWRATGARWLLAWFFGAGLFAAQAIPTFEYVRQCTRTSRGYVDFTENSWNPLSLIGFALPMAFGQRTPNLFDVPYWGPSHQCEQFAYAGVLPLLLAALALRSGWRADPRRRGWIALAAVGLLTSLGFLGPVAPILYWLPGASLFRVPARAMLLVNLALAALAARSVHELAARRTPDRARLRFLAQRWTARPARLALLVVGVPTAALSLATLLLPHSRGVPTISDMAPWRPAVLVPLAAWLLSLALLGTVAKRWESPRLRALLPLVLALDLGVIGWSIDVPTRALAPEPTLWPNARMEWVSALDDTRGRIWVVTSRTPRLPGEYVDSLAKGVANVNILDNVVSLTDYGPFQPRALDRVFGFKPWGEAPRLHALLNDTAWMQWYNVEWVLLCEPSLPEPRDCVPVLTTSSGYRLYRNPNVRGAAYLLDAAAPVAVHHEAHAPYRMTTRVDTFPREGPGDRARLVLSQLALPGWRASIDGEPLPVEALDGTLLSLRLPDRTPLRIDWEYSPPGLFVGIGVTLLTALALGGVCAYGNLAGR